MIVVQPVSATERLAGFTVGTIESIDPRRFVVLLDHEAPQSTSLNTGAPRPFPRINGYLLVSSGTGIVVGQITWLGIERSAFPKRTGLKDFGLVDLPYPLRKLYLMPVGMLVKRTSTSFPVERYDLERGVTAFPSVGDPVVLPTSEQLTALVSSTGEDARVVVGRSPIADHAFVSVDPDKLFGRHVAVLGNTGSGKSCTVAGLIRWSLDAARAARTPQESQSANARFVVLDPNGEYRRVFSDLPGPVNVFRVRPPVGEEPVEGSGAAEGEDEPFGLPAWMWNLEEWSGFTAASARAQQPMLMQALRELRWGQVQTTTPAERTLRMIRGHKNAVSAIVNAGPLSFTQFPGKKDCGNLLRRLADDADNAAARVNGSLRSRIEELKQIVDELIARRADESRGVTYWQPFSEADLEGVLDAFRRIEDAGPRVQLSELPNDPDSPVAFDVSALPDQLASVADRDPSAGATQFVSYLTVRIRSMLQDGRIRAVIDPPGGGDIVEWLDRYVQMSDSSEGSITIVDLSLVPADVLHLVMAATSRIIFEALQRYRRLEGFELPTVLVLEEAHSFIQRDSRGEVDRSGPGELCRRTFERIAREGRKFGVGLMISSQRPSEISQTVLAQCNSFILHRLVNDRDQDYVRRLVPDTLGELLRELPSLPAQHAILLGWASPIPKLVKVWHLEDSMRPHSDDPRYWSVWTGQEVRRLSWRKVAREWTIPGGSADPDPEGEREG